MSNNLHSNVITAEKPVVELPYDFFAPKTTELPEEVQIALGYSAKGATEVEIPNEEPETPKTTQTINQLGKNFVLTCVVASSSVTMALITLALFVATLDYFTYDYSYTTTMIVAMITFLSGMVTRKLTIKASDLVNQAITNNFLSPVVSGLIIVGLSLSWVAIQADNASPLVKELMGSVKKNSPWQQKRDIADAEQREIRSKLIQWEANSYLMLYSKAETAKPKVKPIEPMPKSNSSLY